MRGVVVWLALVACSSSPPAPTLITNGYIANDLRVQGDTLYFHALGAVWSIPTDGGPTATRLYDSACGGMTVDANAVYFYGPKHADSTCDLMAAPLAGGTPVVLAPGGGPGSFAITDSLAVIVTDRVTTVPLSGGSPTVIATLPGNLLPASIMIDGTALYWTVTGQYSQTCATMALTGGTPTSWGCMGNGDIVVDAADVYVTRSIGQCPPCTTLWRSTVGGLATAIAQDNDNYFGGLGISDHHLYWRTNTRIFRVDLDGGDGSEIAELNDPNVNAYYASYIHDMTIDDRYVYWSTDYQTSIWRSPK